MKVRNEIEIPQSAIDAATKKEIKSLKAKLVSANNKTANRDAKIAELGRRIKELEKELVQFAALREACRVFYEQGQEDGYDGSRGGW